MEHARPLSCTLLESILVASEETNTSPPLTMPGESAAASNAPTAPAKTAEKRADRKSIIDLTKYMDKQVRVKFIGGREVVGILRGFDPLLNLVLDSTSEYLRDPDDPFKVTNESRSLGLSVCRGTGIVVITPQDGHESIPNPFIQHE